MPKGKQFWKYYALHTPEHQSYVKGVQEAWHKKKCSLCGARALYRAGRKVYCSQHKQVASDWWARHPMKVDDRLTRGYMEITGDNNVPRKY